VTPWWRPIISSLTIISCDHTTYYHLLLSHLLHVCTIVSDSHYIVSFPLRRPWISHLTIIPYCLVFVYSRVPELVPSVIASYFNCWFQLARSSYLLFAFLRSAVVSCSSISTHLCKFYTTHISSAHCLVHYIMHNYQGMCHMTCECDMGISTHYCTCRFWYLPVHMTTDNYIYLSSAAAKRQLWYFTLMDAAYASKYRFDDNQRTILIYPWRDVDDFIWMPVDYVEICFMCSWTLFSKPVWKSEFMTEN
jgi:hypothetical protein